MRELFPLEFLSGSEKLHVLHSSGLISKRVRSVKVQQQKKKITTWIKIAYRVGHDESLILKTFL
jgi:hypothetical protein